MLQTQSIVVVAKRKHADLLSSLTIDNARIIYLYMGESELPAAIGSDEPDIVILDCGADADDGITILEELKSLRNDLPVIFLTDASSEETVLKAFKRGAREYFRKPVDLHELQQTVERILLLRRSGRESRTSLKVHAPDFSRMSGKLPPHLPHAISRAVMHIHDNFSRTLYLDDLARAAHLSKFHFCRNFKHYIGVSPMRFVNMVKIRKAQALLLQANVTISTVAYSLGFNDQSEFTRQFKNITGVSPSAYRRSHLH
ncbi:MAG: AraC family transcriptional regulator [Geobacter sp.]|nr:MAG: AraC family transcriptional regulator [Geobacter sp.]